MEHKQLLTVFNSLPVGIGFFTADGTLVRCNESFCRIFGADSQTLLGNKLNINENSVVPDVVKEAVRRCVPVQMSFLYDFDKQRTDKRFFSTRTRTCYLKCNGNPLYDNDGKFVNYIFIFEDITETVKSEEVLRQSRRKTELAMKAANIMFWEFDAVPKLFYSDNEPLNGYDQSKPVSMALYLETLHPDDRSQVTEVMERMSNGEDFSFSFDSRVMLPDSSTWQFCTISGAPYEFDSNKKVLKYVGTRKNNTEVQKKEQFFYNILNNLPLSVHIKDVENDSRYVFCNEESKLMFGTSEDKTTYDVLSEEEVERIQKTDLEVYNTGNPYFGMERIILKDGRSYDTIVRKSIIEDDGKRFLLNTRWDQSLQNELKRRAQLLTVTMEAMNAFTWFFEPAKNRVSFGEGFDKNGKKASEINSVEKYLTLVHPDDRQKFAETLQKAVELGSGVWDVEYRIDFKGDGMYQWWETRGLVETTTLNDAPYKYLFGMTQNIDSYKQTELTLLKNKEIQDALVRQNELVLNNTNSGLAYITKEYMVQWENISLCSKSLSFEAYKKGELCYKSTYNRTSPCENCVMQRAFVSLQTEQMKFSLDSAHTVEVFATPVVLEDGSVDGVVIRVDDVTEREKMIKELQEAKHQAEQSDKLKSAFLANMSHEIRTPLNAIVGFSELMAYAGEEEKADYIQIINSNNELLLKLINDILDLSKLEAGSVELKYEPFDLSEHFENMFTSMKQRLKNPDIVLTEINPYHCCQVTLDRNRVAQIITNYVTNAIKYTSKGSIKMGYACKDGGVYFYVKDTGIGIADDKKGKVFQRFEKLDEFAQGTGLGLSICKAIAEAMGGKVGFESVHNEGSLFWAFLPCEVDTLSMVEEKKEENISGGEFGANDEVMEKSAGRKTILIAEDIQSNYQLVSTILKDHYDLLHAENGQKAVEIARSQHVDLLLMDMKMPVLDGLKATAEIRKFNASLPIVALTAHAFDSDRIAAIKVGCNEYLVKPIEKMKLMVALKKYL